MNASAPPHGSKRTIRGRRAGTRRLFVGLALLSQTACDTPAPGPEDPGSDPADDLITALMNQDRSFALAVGANGLAEATRTFVADAAILFQPEPVEASVWLSEEHPEPASLQWVATAAALASSGDLGYTTGPFIATDDQGQEGQGTYLTIWQGDGDGYRVVLDMATFGPDAGPLPEPADGAASFEVIGMTPSAAMDPARDSAALESLKEIDRGYAVAQATNGTAAAMVSRAANTVRVHRAGRLPIVGSADEAAKSVLAGERPSTSPVDGRVSHSGTLGYVYGSVSAGDEGNGGNYVRIWRRDPGGAWSLAVEVIDAILD